jgi:Family of unknown function (DUF6178)
MTKDLAASGRARRRDLLTHLLEEPDLVALVRALDTPALGALVRHVGLEDAGEIVDLVTSEQLARILDEDVWRSQRPGEDEVFDAERFAVWLEVLLESGDEKVADKLVDLPEELVILGFHRQVLVLDMDALETEVASLDRSDADAVEKALDGCLCEELGEYRIISRRHDGWDAVIAILLALDRNHHAFLARVLERLCHASSELIEENGGLCDALSSAEMIAEDAAADREDRRAAEGFVSPSSARSFLALARKATAAEVLAEKQRDPVTRAYFRELGAAPLPAQEGGAASPRPLIALLRAAEAESPGALLLESALSARPRDEQLFRDAMRELARTDPAAYGSRLEELGYLVNVLLVGTSRDGRVLRPAEAAEQAVTTCNLGLVQVCKSQEEAVAILARTAADQLFRIGFAATP